MATTGLIAKVYQCPYIKAKTIAAVDSNPDTYTDTGSGFVTAGFAAGDSITVAGFTTGGNNGVKTIATVVAGTITLDAGDTLTGEAAGDEVTIIKNVPGTLIGACKSWAVNQTAGIEDISSYDQTIKESYTASTIAFVEGGASKDTITDSAAQFVAEGFVAGDRLWITGSSTTNNNKIVTIFSVTTTTITIIATDDLVDEAAGSSITLRSLNMWKMKTSTTKDWTATLDKFWDTTGQTVFGVPRRYELFLKYYASPSESDVAWYYEGLGIANAVNLETRVLEVVKQPITIEGIGTLTLTSKTTAW